MKSFFKLHVVHLQFEYTAQNLNSGDTILNPLSTI
jgi:hypothetical protein